MIRAVTTLLLCSLSVPAFAATGNSDLYYWREYTGVIPPDALPGGKDPDGQTLYIGEAYIHGNGFYMGTIYPGIKEVQVPCYGPKTASINIKILCTENPEYFQWIKTSSGTYHNDTADVEVVTAGYDGNWNNGRMTIGRLFYQGHTLIGNVTPWASRKPTVAFFFAFQNNERNTLFYELLVMHVYDVDPRISKSNTINITIKDKK